MVLVVNQLLAQTQRCSSSSPSSIMESNLSLHKVSSLLDMVVVFRLLGQQAQGTPWEVKRTILQGQKIHSLGN